MNPYLLRVIEMDCSQNLCDVVQQNEWYPVPVEISLSLAHQPIVINDIELAAQLSSRIKQIKEEALIVCRLHYCCVQLLVPELVCCSMDGIQESLDSCEIKTFS